VTYLTTTVQSKATKNELIELKFIKSDAKLNKTKTNAKKVGDKW
jgi:hypothetical protein